MNTVNIGLAEYVRLSFSSHIVLWDSSSIFRCLRSSTILISDVLQYI